MTAVEERAPIVVAIEAGDVSPEAVAETRGPGPVGLVLIGIVVLAVLLAVFEFWVTSVQEARSQTALLQQMKRTLSTGAEGGAAPLPHPGQPLGLIEIPAIGVEKVVVEGTAAKRLKAGPGHDPASAWPGRSGDALILGKSSSYNSPFAHLDRLRSGDKIIVTTGAGRSTYIVDEQGTRAQPNSRRGTLTLVTSSPALLSSGLTTVVATLDGRPLRIGHQVHRAATVNPATVSGYFQDPGAIAASLFWGALLIAALVVAARGYRRSAWLAWVLTTPIIVALLFCLLGSLDRLLPVTR
jgi:sortase A